MILTLPFGDLKNSSYHHFKHKNFSNGTNHTSLTCHLHSSQLSYPPIGSLGTFSPVSEPHVVVVVVVVTIMVKGILMIMVDMTPVGCK